MKKGFATTGVLYTVLIIGLVLMVTFLIHLQSKKSILDGMRKEAKDNINSEVECSHLNDEYIKIRNKYNKLLKENEDLKKLLEQTTAEKDDIIDGKIAYSKGNIITGIMQNRGTITVELKAGESYVLKNGNYIGGNIIALSLASQTVATATSSQILIGYTAWVNGEKIEGTIKGYDEGYNEGNSSGYEQGYKNAQKGTATPSDVLEGKTFTSQYGVNLTGTMQKVAGANHQIKKGDTYIIPEGYHDGTGTVSIGG